MERAKIDMRAWASVVVLISVSRPTGSIFGISELSEGLRSRDAFRDFRERVITLPILLIKFSVELPFRSNRDLKHSNDQTCMLFPIMTYFSVLTKCT